MKLRNTLLIATTIVALIMTSCNSEDKFKVKGNFASASDKMIYLEHRDLSGIKIVDSIKIDSNGSFKFKCGAPTNPEFYQLRVDGKIVVFVVEGTEDINVSGDFKNLQKSFVVANSPDNDQIKIIDIKTNDLKLQLSALEKQHSQKEIDDLEYLENVESLLSEYKSDISKIIIGNPSGAAAYYAVFQKVNDYLIFDPYDRKDYPMYGAVATSWNKNYEGSSRAKHIYEFTMNAFKVRKSQEYNFEALKNANITTESSLPDIILKSVDGKSVSLSSLKGKVVILDFTVYGAEFSPKHNIELNKVYTQLKPQGVEIYQISFDSDEHLWKNAAINLPWITVRDPESVYSRLLATYNVKDVPTAYIVNKEGDIISRVENYETLIQEVRKAL